ncbi:hypothetical protein [Piscinibacter defluvii]|uniref:hypothetical protein n=1 Tax=Piscinibacter defluvii TaxID=1796922 RepID=UPI000FDE657D|nr:hypothetical protein [Piscinibacter defluvii]
MNKQLFVLCHSDRACASAIEAVMNSCQIPSLAPEANPAGEDLSSILEGVLAMAGLTPTQMIPRGWAGALQPSFDAVAAFYLDALLAGQASSGYLSASANAFFVDAWRALCARMSVSVRFVYVRDFSRLYQPSKDAPMSAADFNVALALLRQAGADVLCFEADELRGGSTALLAPLLSGSRSPAQLPAAQVADVVRNLPGALRAELPAEIAALHRLYVGRRRGIALTLPAGSPDLALLESSAQPRTAFHLWLESGAASGARALAAATAVPAPARPDGDLVALLVQRERRIDALIQQLREQEAAAAMQKPVRGKRVGAAAEAGDGPKSVPAAGGPAHKRSIPERVWRKLKKIATKIRPAASAPAPDKRVTG